MKKVVLSDKLLYTKGRNLDNRSYLSPPYPTIVWTIHVAFQLHSERLKGFSLVFHLPQNSRKNNSNGGCATG